MYKLILLVFLLSLNAFAIGPQSLFELDAFYFGYTKDTYQIGDQWGKLKVNKRLYRNYDVPKASLLAIQATAKLKGGTAFYLGKFAGRHLIATNYHVCKISFECTGHDADFTEFQNDKRKYLVTKNLGLFVPIDLAIFEIEVNEGERVPTPIAFDFDFEILKGSMLTSAGYGIGENYNRKFQMITFDDDCKVFSKDDDFKLMKDPDSINPAYYKAWSFAVGCDSSHGDSGSAVLDRETGANIGILWTGGFPKSDEARSSKALTSWLNENDERIWKELSYIVPAKKIRELILKAIDAGEIKERDIPSLKALVN